MVSSIQISCDSAVARAAPFVGTPHHPWLALIAATAASSLVYVDGAVIAIGLPAVGKAFAIQGSELQWVLNAYLLALACRPLVGDHAGR